jgi:hypothetical protein
MRLRYSFWSMAASLVLVILSTQAQLFAQYTINTFASSTGSLLIHGQGVAVDSANNVYVDGTFNGYTWPAAVKATASGLSVVAGTSSLYGSTAAANRRRMSCCPTLAEFGSTVREMFTLPSRAATRCSASTEQFYASRTANLVPMALTAS